MRKLLAILERLFQGKPCLPLSAAPSLPPEWTADHITAWRKFLSEPIGQDLISRARARECSLALNACQNPGVCTPDRAAGFSDGLNWIISLSQISVSTAAHVENYETRDAQSDVPDTELSYSH